MGKWKRFIVVSGLVPALVVGATAVQGQEAPEPADTPADRPFEDPDEKKNLFPFYVAIAFGGGGTKNLNTSIATDVNFITNSRVKLEEQQFGRAEIGWQLADQKGDFRIVFNGYKEEEYEFESVAGTDALGGTQFLNPAAGSVFAWWDLEIKDGELVAQRFPPGGVTTGGPWTFPQDDLNGNGLPDPEELVRLDCSDPGLPLQSQESCRTVSKTVPDDLQNQIQTFDFLYGREFPKWPDGRRFSSRWWAGLRYFEYEGQLPATAWLDLTSPSVASGFTDGVLLPLLNLSQESSGIGPTGSWEVDFNFFNKGLVLFLRGQAAFTFNSLEVDSDPFFTLVNEPTGPGTTISAPARLTNSRDKSSWQLAGEAGVRVKLRNGLQFELAYIYNDYEDAVLLPFDITVPESLPQVPNGTSALFNTHDYEIWSIHGGVGFQY